MENKATALKMVPISNIVAHPRNANKHPFEQIERLSKIMEYQGFREPVIVSNRSGFLVAGHGRIEAAKLLGLTEVPVLFQDFENEAQEYAHMIADNEIARWAELDQMMVKDDLKDLGLDNLDMLGLDDMSFLDVEIQVGKTETDKAPTIEGQEKEKDYWLLIKCKDELDRSDIYEEMVIRELEVEMLDKSSDIAKVKKLIKKKKDNGE